MDSPTTLAAPVNAFFDRVAELRSLKVRLASPPAAVIVLTELLKKLVASVDQTAFKPSIVDCRAGEYLSPTTFANNLLNCMHNDWNLSAEAVLAALTPSLKAVTSSALGVSVTFDSLQATLQKEAAPLQCIMDTYLKLVKDAKQKRAKENDPWPVIIIDEANRLSAWGDTVSLEQLLAFFVYITKQERLAHVILATSDTFFSQWLDAGPIKEDFRAKCVLGNFARKDADTFFIRYVAPFTTDVPPVESDTFARVYEVCGGNPGLLRKCAIEAAAKGSWEDGCLAIVNAADERITKGLNPSAWPGAAWSADDCRTVLHAIVSSPHCAVPMSQLAAALDVTLFGLRLWPRDGAKILASMNQKKLLLRRAYDSLAGDIPPAAFGAKLQDVYTLPSAAHIVAARRALEL